METHLDNVFGGDKVPTHSELPEKQIQPWHKPRKQWIRRYQWLEQITDLCKQLNLRETRPLRYLSLPGEDLLDVRVVRECCKDAGAKLRYLGLNDDFASEQPNTWLHVASNEVNSLPEVHRDSIVIKDRFERIADQSSVAYKYVKQYGPFDVVNLDLCESLSPLRQRSPNYYAALECLATHQIHTRPANEPWLLLITSRVGGPWVFDVDMGKLAKCIAENAKAHKEFAIKLNQLVPQGLATVQNPATNWKKINQPEFLNLFTVGFGKWLLHLLTSASPKWAIKLLSSYSYRVKASDPDMVSLAFSLECFPEAPTDRFGLSSGQRSATGGYDEKKFALKLLDSVGEVSDLDTKLNGDRTTYAAMEQETFELLKSARYKPDVIRAAMKKFALKVYGGRI